MLLQVFILHHIQNFQSNRARDWVATESGKIFHAIVESICDRACCDDTSERMPVAHSFAQHHNIWDNTLSFKAPEMRTYPPEAGLYFINNTYPTGLAYIMK